MVDFIKSNLSSILFVIMVVLAMILAIRLGYIKQVKQMLLAFVIKAEKEFGGGTGEIKFAAVAGWVWERLPAVARFFISQTDVGNLIEEAVAYMKEYLSKNEKAAALVSQKTE